MPGRPIKAVLFDLGDTLVSFGTVQRTRAVWQGARLSYKYLRAHGQRPGPFFWYAVDSTIRLRWQLLRSGIIGRDFNVLDLFVRVGLKKGIDLSESQWQELAWAWYEPLVWIARVEPNLQQTLGTLEDMGLDLGLLSNTFLPSSCLDRHLEQLGLLQYLPVRLYSYQYPYRKPDRRIFLDALIRLGHDPDQVLFVGDRLDWDIRPAVRLGMHAALIRRSRRVHRRVPEGAAVIERLDQLPALVKSVNRRFVTARAAGGSITNE